MTTLHLLHLAVSGLTVRLPVWPWQQVCVKPVRKWGVRATWIFIMTSPVYWLQCGGHTQVRLFGPPESTVNWPREEEGGGGFWTHSTYKGYPGSAGSRQLDRWRCIYCYSETAKPSQPKEKINHRSYRKFDIDKCKNNLTNSDLIQNLNTNSATSLYALMSILLDKNAPLKSFNVTPNRRLGAKGSYLPLWRVSDRIL